MTPRRARWAAPLAVAVALVMGGCQAAPSPSASARPTTAATCAELAARIVDAVQDYVDSFAHVSAGQVSDAVSARQADFAAATKTLRERGESLGCNPTELADLIRGELGRLTGGTPVQDAVADTFRADPLGTVDPSDLGPAEIPVATALQLVTAVTRAGSGSTIRLAPGTYALAAPLVTLRPITLVGAGDGSDPERTSTITSLAAGAALIAATSGNLALTDLAITHKGERAASVVVVAGGGYDFQRVRITGGVAEKGAGGYGIVLRPSSGPLTPTGDRRVLSGVTLVGNDGGGVVIAGSEQPTISGVRVTGSDGCGLCWVEQAAGTASDLSLVGAKIGLRIDNEASPVVTRAQVKDADVGVALTGSGSPRVEDAVLTGGAIGLQATGSGTATLVGNQVLKAKEIGIRLSGTTRTALERNSVSGATKVGIATLASAASTITGGQVTSTGDVGLIWGDQATGTVADVVIRGPQLGVQLAASVKVDLTGVVADGAKAAALLASGKASGTVTRLICGKDEGAAVVFTDTATVRLVDSPTCKVFQR